MTFPQTLSIPMALFLSLTTGVGGAWVSSERTQAGLAVRMEATERKIDVLQTQLGTYVPTPEFTLALSDVKRELDNISSDLKEIRRTIGSR